MRTSYKGGAAALLCSALTLTACGSASTSSSPPHTQASTQPATQVDGATIVAAAYTKTSAAKSARMALSYSVSAGKTGSGNTLNEQGTGTGVIDFARKIADLTVNAPTGQSIEERLIGTNAYVKLPPQLASTSPQLKGKSWLHEQLPSGGGSSLGFGSSNSSQASDPTSILRMVSTISNRVDNVGTNSIRGTQTTHYRATVNFAKAAAKSGLSTAQITQLEKLLGTTTLPVDIWVDKQGVARRLQFHFPLPKLGSSTATQSGQMTETLDLYDFGIPVSVSPPPASQVAEFSALGGGAGGTGSTGSTAATPSSGVRTG
jgi:hypothetical protein